MSYAVLVLALLPFASQNLAPVPQIAGIYATAVLFADLCTFVLLTAQFRARASPWLLVLACAYLYSALMALLHLLTFPGAVIPGGPVLGAGQTVSWAYILWSLGFVALLFWAVLAAPRTGGPSIASNGPAPALATAIAVVLASVAVLVLVTTAGVHLLPALTVGDRFSPWSVGMNGLRAALALAALLVLWTARRRSTVILLWLSLTLTAAAAGPLLTDLGGGRYTLGWYAGRASFTVAAYVLLIVLLAEFVKLQRALARTVDRLESQTRSLSAEIQRREAAETVSREKDVFLAMLSHELRNTVRGAIPRKFETVNRPRCGPLPTSHRP